MIRQGNTIDGFNLIAPVYDISADILTLGMHRVWRNLFCRMFLQHSPRQARLLDIGTGTGDILLRALLKRPDLSACGLDMSEGMLGIASAKLNKKNLFYKNNIEFKLGNALALPFSAASYHTVTMCWSVGSFKPLQAALREALRVLKPGGTLCILDHGVPEPRFIRPLLNKYAHSLPVFGNKLFSSKAVYPMYVNSEKEAAAGKNFVAHLFEAGFTKVTYTTHAGGLIYMYVAKKSLS